MMQWLVTLRCALYVTATGSILLLRRDKTRYHFLWPKQYLVSILFACDFTRSVQHACIHLVKLFLHSNPVPRVTHINIMFALGTQSHGDSIVLFNLIIETCKSSHYLPFSNCL